MVSIGVPLKRTNLSTPGAGDISAKLDRGTMPAWVMYNELVQTSKLYARNVGVIDAGWLPELLPDLFVVGS